METERPEGLVRDFRWRFYIFAPLMAFLAPLLADSLHTFFLVYGGHSEFYMLLNAELGHIATARYWSYVAARGVITLLVVWFFARIRFREFWVWLCFVGLWTWLDLESEFEIK